MQKKVLISGAGIAGPALAYWLARRGFVCTIVERAPSLRVGGQAVDFRGPIHREVLERMDLWNAIHERRTAAGDLVMLNRAGDPVAALPAVMLAGDVEILRGDLCDLLFDRTRHDVEYVFDDHVVALRNHANGVDITLASGSERTFDFVVGADGLHSGIRALAYENESAILKHRGYRVASFPLPSSFGVARGTMLYSMPGRAMSVGGGRASCIFTGDPFGNERRDLDEQKRAIRKRYEGLGWLVPDVLDALDASTDAYVDAIATVHVDRYAHDRVVLLGDAAFGGTLGGQGTSLAIVGAYVLAGEIGNGEDFANAFARYETRMRPYATRCQKGAIHVGPFFAPRTHVGLTLRNFMYWALTTRPFIGFFERLVKDAATDFALPRYV